MDFSHRTVRFFLTEQFNTEISQWALFSNQSPYSIYLRNQLPGKFPNTASDAYFSSSKSVLPILSLSYQKNPKLSKPELVSSYLHGPMSCYPETYSQPFFAICFSSNSVIYCNYDFSYFAPPFTMPYSASY